MSITNIVTTENEIVISEDLTTTDFKIVGIHEDIAVGVRVEVEVGPFVPHTFGPEGYEVIRMVPTSTKGIPVWTGDEYRAIRDTWTNADLISAVASRL
jgi:hypothetical protein